MRNSTLSLAFWMSGLAMSQADQTALVMAKLNEEFPFTEWLLWVFIKQMANGFRHIRCSLCTEDGFKETNGDNVFMRTNGLKATDDLPSFATLLRYGFLERGVWGQEQFYRLTEFAISLISRQKSDEIGKFYLTPNFEIVAPMGTRHIYCLNWVNV